MNRLALTEQDQASLSGPRDMKTPGELDWCWQTVSALQSMWKSLDLDFERYQWAWQEAEEHRIWERIPQNNPYGTKEAMLERLQVGDEEAARTRVAVNALAFGERRGSHNAKYLTARIARDRPDIWERMKAGEFTSVAAAARAAGIPYKVRQRIALGDPLTVAQALRRHFTLEERQQLAKALLQEYD